MHKESKDKKTHLQGSTKKSGAQPLFSPTSPRSANSESEDDEVEYFPSCEDKDDMSAHDTFSLLESLSLPPPPPRAPYSLATIETPRDYGGEGSRSSAIPKDTEDLPLTNPPPPRKRRQHSPPPLTRGADDYNLPQKRHRAITPPRSSSNLYPIKEV